MWLFRSRYDALSIIPSQLMNVDTFSELRSHRKWHILAILEQTRNGFVAKKPQDKVFGLLAICVETQSAQWPAALNPDYNIQPGVVFQQVASLLIESTRSLTVLSLECRGAGSDGIPSWVSDLTGSSFYRTGYQAALGLSLELVPDRDPKILAVRGVLIDTVAVPQSQGQIHRASRPSKPLTPPDMNEDCEAPWVVELWEIEELARSFHRIATAGQGTSGSAFHSEDEYQQSFSDCCAYLLKRADSHRPTCALGSPEFLTWHCGSRDLNSFFALARRVCVGRRFFRAAGGRMGMGPGSMLKGDCLSVLIGGDVPYILRPKEGWYLFIGDCFVDGLMGG
ncbi:hypothetical protein B0O99DRAFT_599536 [Bisporella sp. PMI_857]|nr:hypothetical protein B0O99DRAFT_599536 [Bisporella sp. PMI_857]